jgi:hypothetical protein
MTEKTAKTARESAETIKCMHVITFGITAPAVEHECSGANTLRTISLRCRGGASCGFVRSAGVISVNFAPWHRSKTTSKRNFEPTFSYGSVHRQMSQPSSKQKLRTSDRAASTRTSENCSNLQGTTGSSTNLKNSLPRFY